jgi:hypothetical protein
MYINIYPYHEMTVTAANIHLYRALLDVADDDDNVVEAIASRRMMPKYADVMKGSLTLSTLTKRAASKDAWIDKYITNCTNKRQLYRKFIVAHVPVPSTNDIMLDPRLPELKLAMINNMKDEIIFPYKWGLTIQQYKQYCSEILKAGMMSVVNAETQTCERANAAI